MSRSCLTPVELLDHVLADPAPSDSHRVQRHVVGCADCSSAIAELRTAANALRSYTAMAPPAASDCVNEETLAALADGSIALSTARRELEHLRGCARCCRELALSARLLEDPAIVRETARLASGHGARRGGRRTVGAIGAVAAAAVLIVAVGRLVPNYQPEARTYREVSLTGAAPPAPLAPLGATAAPAVFRWRSVPRADRYRITIFDRDGSAVWDAQTHDTTITLPRKLSLVDGDTYLWRIEARVGWEDRWAASDLVAFTIHSDSSR